MSLTESGKEQIKSLLDNAIVSIGRLGEQEILYWSSLTQWPLVDACFLSLGYHPHSRTIIDHNLPINIYDNIDDDIWLDALDRLSIAANACRDGSLKYKKNPCPGVTITTFERYDNHKEYIEVDVRNFITWARDNFKINHEHLYIKTLDQYKSTAHVDSGKRKGKDLKDAKTDIAQYALDELENGCMCHHTELAKYLCEEHKDASMIELKE